MITETISPIENIYPADDYIHALAVSGASRQLFVSGTMGLDAQGVPAKDIDTQLGLIWQNLRCILKAAGMTVDNIVRVTSYLTRAEYQEQNMQARVKALGSRHVPTTVIVAQTLDPAWLVEVEIIAAD